MTRSRIAIASGAAAVCLFLNAGCAAAGSTIHEENRKQGYLNPNDLPDSVALLPPPPAPGSVASALDEEVTRRSLALRGTPRWKLASDDADLTFPKAAGTFSCALDAPVTERDTPHLYRLLRRTLVDAGRSTSAAKNGYRRVRPFAANGEPTCTPEQEKYLAHDSYPSGHTAVGWAWALILGEIAPDRLDRILSRGLDFGESRVICNVHWQSDVIEGRIMGAATVSRLHADRTFTADLAAAKAELAAVRLRGDKPQRDCVAEEAALKQPHEVRR